MIEQKNKLNIRVRGIHSNKVFNRIKHNIRHIQCKSHINNNNNILIDINSGKTFEYLSYKNTLSHRMYKDFSTQYMQDRNTHNQLHKKYHKRKARDYHGTWAEGILTFSEAILEDLGAKYSEEKLIKIAINMLKDFESKWDTKIEMLCLHLDERTPHFQFLFKNYDNTGMSIVHKKKNRSDLSGLQDLMFHHFKELGMERGVKKVDTECGINDYSSPDHNIYIEELKEEVKGLKNDRKSITNDISISKQEKKKIYAEITTVQKELRSKIKHLNEVKKRGQKLVKKVKELTNDSVTVEEAKSILDSHKKLQHKNVDINKLHKTISQKNKQLKEQFTDLKDYEKELTNTEKIVDKKTNEVKALEFALTQEKEVVSSLSKKLQDIRIKMDLKDV